MKIIDSLALGRKCSWPRKEAPPGDREKPQQNGEVRTHLWLHTGTSRAERWKSLFLATDRFSRNLMLQSHFLKATHLDYMTCMHKGGAIAYPRSECSRTWNQTDTFTKWQGFTPAPIGKTCDILGPNKMVARAAYKGYITSVCASSRNGLCFFNGGMQPTSNF